MTEQDAPEPTAVEVARFDLHAAINDVIALKGTGTDVDPEPPERRLDAAIDALADAIRAERDAEVKALRDALTDAANELLHASGHCDEWVKARYIKSAEAALRARALKGEQE